MMPSLVCLLAQIGKSNSGQTGQPESAWNIQAALVVGVIVLTIGLLSGSGWLISRYLAARGQQLANSPWGIFKELCAAHGLNHRERQWLSRLARQHDLEQPASIFVEPTWWDAERIGPAWQSALPQLHELRDRLFSRT